MSPMVSFIVGLFIGEGLAILILALCSANNVEKNREDDDFGKSY